MQSSLTRSRVRSAANVKRSNETKPGGLSSLGNLGLRSVNTMPPELRRMAHKLSDAQLQELARRIRDRCLSAVVHPPHKQAPLSPLTPQPHLHRVAIISESLEVQYHKRRQKLDANGVFDVDINKSRTEAMHHVAIQRRLRPGDLEGEVLREMLAEEHYRKLLTESVDDLEGKMNKWFMGTEFQNLTAAVCDMLIAWWRCCCCCCLWVNTSVTHTGAQLYGATQEAGGCAWSTLCWCLCTKMGPRCQAKSGTEAHH